MILQKMFTDVFHHTVVLENYASKSYNNVVYSYNIVVNSGAIQIKSKKEKPFQKYKDNYSFQRGGKF